MWFYQKLIFTHLGDESPAKFGFNDYFEPVLFQGRIIVQHKSNNLI